MAEDPLEAVLRLVAEGRLTPDEAAPILAELDGTSRRPGPSTGRPSSTAEASSATSSTAGAAGDDGSATGAGRTLRIEVRDAGRTVVNLRLPLALGRYALDRIPGLSGEQADRVRDALRSGMTGPVLVVDDDNGGVRIAID